MKKHNKKTKTNNNNPFTKQKIKPTFNTQQQKINTKNMFKY